MTGALMIECCSRFQVTTSPTDSFNPLELTQKSKLARLDPVQNPLLSLRPHFPSYLEATSRATDGDAAENRAGNLIESRHLQRAHPHRAPSTLKMEGPSHLDLADNFEEVLVDFLVEKHQRPKNHLELDGKIYRSPLNECEQIAS